MNLLRDWNLFWFRSRDVSHLGLFRIALGLVALMKLFLLIPIMQDCFGEKGLVSLASSLKQLPPPRIGLLDALPTQALPLYFVVLIAIGIFFTIGWMTRLMNIALFIGLLSLDNRNPWILNSGDTLLNIFLFYSIFAPLGESFSVDRWITRLRGRIGAHPAVGSFWAVRLMQFQICMVYFWSAYSKIHGPAWEKAEAIYWTYNNVEISRFSIPFLTHNLIGINFLTYFTLLVEGLFPFTVWWKRTRGYIIGAGILLHLGIEWSMNIQIFQYVALSSYLLFFDGAEVMAVWDRCRSRFHLPV